MKLTPTLRTHEMVAGGQCGVYATLDTTATCLSHRLLVCLFVCLVAHAPYEPRMSGLDSWANQLARGGTTLCVCVWMKIIIRCWVAYGGWWTRGGGIVLRSLRHFIRLFWLILIIYCRCLRFAYAPNTLTILLLLFLPLFLLLLWF